MSTIVTRAGKGSALTWTEGDANVTNLNNDKIEDIVEDTTPQLGGNLDVNGNSIVSTSNANINITPNGTGRVVLSGQSFPAAASAITGTVTDVDAVRDPNTLTLSNATGVTNNAVITFSGAGVTSLGLTVGVEYKIWALIGGGAAELALNSGGGTISITDPGTITDVNYSVAGAGPTVGHVLTYGSSGNLSWASASSTTELSTDTSPQLGGNLDVNGNNITNTSGRVRIYGVEYPDSNGSNGQVLTSNGSGQANWGTPATFDPASPGAIGGTTKAAGTFTTMTADTAVLDDIRETVSALTYGATITPDAADGSIRTITLTGNVTFSAFSNPVSGQTITLIITQDGTGSRTLTSTMKFAGASKTLSTAAGSIDILTVSYIGTTYYASLSKAFA